MDKRDTGVERVRSIWLHGAPDRSGGHVDVNATASNHERPQPGWLESSWELHDGLDVAEFSGPMAQEAFDRLFRA